MSAVREPVTTPEIINDFAGETGVPKEQLLLIVARSALIRKLATDPKTKERFVVKGGTLLYHVYGAQRMSVRDADLAHPSDDELLPDVEDFWGSVIDSL